GVRVPLHAREPQLPATHRAARALRGRAGRAGARARTPTDLQGRVLLSPRRCGDRGSDPAVRGLRSAGGGRRMVGGVRRGRRRAAHLGAERRLREERRRRDAGRVRRSRFRRRTPHDGEGGPAFPRVHERRGGRRGCSNLPGADRPPFPARARGQRQGRQERYGSVIVVYLLVALVGAVIAVFAIQNIGPVVIRFLGWQIEGALSLVVLLSVLLGIVLASLIGVVPHWRLRARIRQLENRVARDSASQHADQTPR